MHVLLSELEIVSIQRYTLDSRKQKYSTIITVALLWILFYNLLILLLNIYLLEEISQSRKYLIFLIKHTVTNNYFRLKWVYIGKNPMRIIYVNWNYNCLLLEINLLNN